MKKLFLFLCLLASLTVQSQEYVITKYGASTDSTKLNTVAIQKLIDRVSAKAGGTIVIPKGIFLTGALFFKPKTKLRLAQGAVLKGSDNIAHYPLIPSRMEGQNLDYYAALVNAYKVEHFSITGPGEINGNGLRYWKAFWAHRDSLKKLNKSSTNLEVHRPRLLFIWGSNRVNIKNVKLRNSGFWTTHLYQCEDVLIDSCDIRSPFAPVKAPSTDGIDIDVCKRVTIRNTYISVNDDAVCIKGGKGPDAQKLPGNGIVEDVLIENCNFGQSHGTLTLGSECIHAKNITLRNCKVDNTCPILRLKMRPDTYQLFENVTVENISGKCGVIIDMNPWKQFFNLGDSKEKPYGTLRNIRFTNIDVTCQSFGTMQGNPADQVSGILLKDIKATSETPAFKNIYDGVKAENVTLNGKPLVVR